MASIATQAKTLIIYYSYTNNVERIVNELRTQIAANVIEVEPAEKGLDYAANNYAIGSAQIAAIRENPDDAASYPAIDPVNVDMSQYSTIIIGAPLWWSNMAAPMQSFLFQYNNLTSGIENIEQDHNAGFTVYSLSGAILLADAESTATLPAGLYIINGKKTLVTR